MSIFLICLKKSPGFWLSVQICPQLDPDPDKGGKSFADPCGFGTETLMIASSNAADSDWVGMDSCHFAGSGLALEAYRFESESRS